MTNMLTSNESVFPKASAFYERFLHPAKTKQSGFTLRKIAPKLIRRLEFTKVEQFLWFILVSCQSSDQDYLGFLNSHW